MWPTAKSLEGAVWAEARMAGSPEVAAVLDSAGDSSWVSAAGSSFIGVRSVRGESDAVGIRMDGAEALRAGAADGAGLGALGAAIDSWSDPVLE
jgi:hypothetical protein